MNICFHLQVVVKDHGPTIREYCDSQNDKCNIYDTVEKMTDPLTVNIKLYHILYY